jgi:signal peptidase II
MRPLARLGAMAAIVTADRASKIWASRWLMPRGSVPLLPFFSFTYVENTGAAFGLGYSRFHMKHSNAFFIGLSAVLFGILVYLQTSWSKKNVWLRTGLLLVAGGALGNLYDRVAYGFVVDFLELPYWPVFNVADSCVSVGACCLFWGMVLEDREAKLSR